jgi:hypothetical protein
MRENSGQNFSKIEANFASLPQGLLKSLMIVLVLVTVLHASDCHQFF